MSKLKTKLIISVTAGLAYVTTSFLTGAAVAQETLTAEQYYDRGCKEANAAKYEASIADYDKAIEKKPQYWEAFGNRGSARFNLQNYEGALQDIDTALAHFPNNTALNELKQRTQNTIAANAAAANQNAEAQRRRANQMLINAQLGGDFADPSTMIMMQAQRRGLMPNTQPIVPIRPQQPVTQSGERNEGNSPFTKGAAPGTGPFAHE